MKASDLPWYGWLLAATVLAFVALDGIVGIVGKPTHQWYSLVLAYGMLAAAVLLAIVGLIRFFKWAWKD
jgi:hypothetical protein